MTLPANLNDLTAALERTLDFAAEAADAVAIFIKMSKAGEWTYGTDEIEIDEESEWAVNPLSFATGYSAFDDDGNRVGEKMALMTEPPVVRADLPSVNGTWSEQVGFSVKCLSSDDEDEIGMEGLLYQRSRGGLEAAKGLLVEVLKRVQKDDENCVAVLQLRNTSYKHSKYGKIYKPSFKIARWVSMDGEEPTPQLEDKTKPKRKTKAKKVVEQEVEQEVEEQPAPSRRRRRRA